MSKLLWSILCKKASIDQASNNVSLFEIVDQLNLQGPPPGERILVPAQFDLATLWMRSDVDTPESDLARLTIEMPDGEIVESSTFEVNLAQAVRHRNILSLSSLPVHGPGLYYFNIELQEVPGEWKRIHQVPLQVTLSPN